MASLHARHSPPPFLLLSKPLSFFEDFALSFPLGHHTPPVTADDMALPHFSFNPSPIFGCLNASVIRALELPEPFDGSPPLAYLDASTQPLLARFWIVCSANDPDVKL